MGKFYLNIAILSYDFSDEVEELLSLMVLLFLVYVLDKGLSYLCQIIIEKERVKNLNVARISETKIKKTISRRGELYEYEFDFNPNVENFNIRLFAKLLDIGFYWLVFYYLDKYFISFQYGYAIFASIFILNAVFEYLFGTTFGKFIFRLEVIDDFGNSPSFLKLILKNLLLLNSVFCCLASRQMLTNPVCEDIHSHNKKTLTYTIYMKDKKSIKDKLSKNNKNI